MFPSFSHHFLIFSTRTPRWKKSSKPSRRTAPTGSTPATATALESWKAVAKKNGGKTMIGFLWDFYGRYVMVTLLIMTDSLLLKPWPSWNRLRTGRCPLHCSGPWWEKSSITGSLWVNFITTSLLSRALGIMINMGNCYRNHPLLCPKKSGESMMAKITHIPEMKKMLVLWLWPT